MIAFLSFAGGYCEYRFEQVGDEIEVQLWRVNPDDGEMKMVESHIPTRHKNLMMAMIMVALEM